MALVTFQRRVLSHERKAREAVIEQYTVQPGRGIMARTAFRPQIAFMNIIGGMTADARRWRQGNMCGLLMTRIASGRLVRPQKREFGHGVVIEARLFPIATIMAFGAIGAVLALVAIILGVTAKACDRRLLNGVVGTVTCRACG